MTRRERVVQSLSFRETDRVPMDLGGMLSTGISCFAYPRLVAALGLPPRPVRVHDTGQMLALPDIDVLDALDCDVVTVLGDATNAFAQPEKWKPYTFNGRLDALVRDPDRFEVLPDGTIVQPQHGCRMPPTAYVFDSEHAGNPLVLTEELPKPNLAALREQFEQRRPRAEDIRAAKELCIRIREATDRAVFFNGPGADIGIAGFGGISVFPVLCMVEPDFVAELHDLVIGYSIERMQALLTEIHPYVDVYTCGSDDWGTQLQTFASPETFRDLFLPYYSRFTSALHAVAPNVKAFLHSCGAVYGILEYVIASGFDVLNPVQWTAGGHTYQEWKDKSRKRLALWGGGVNAQVTLPLGNRTEVENEVARLVAYLRRDGGFIFNGIHNILAEAPAENVVAMYRTAASVR